MFLYIKSLHNLGAFFMDRVLKWYRLINILSIDVAFGAVICALFFAKVAHVQIKPQGLVALGLSVWIIYTLDHLWDAFKVKKEASTYRHRFHQKNFTTIVVLLLLSTVMNVMFILYLRPSILYAGCVLGILVLLYLLLSRFYPVLKEFLVGLLYAAGVAMPAFALLDYKLPHVLLMLWAQFLCACWMNLLLFSWFDFQRDVTDRRDSLATLFGRPVIQKFVVGIFIISVVIALVLLFEKILLPGFILSVMNGMLLLLLIFHRKLIQRERFRLIGDAIFFLPLIYVLYE